MGIPWNSSLVSLKVKCFAQVRSSGQFWKQMTELFGPRVIFQKHKKSEFWIKCPWSRNNFSHVNQNFLSNQVEQEKTPNSTSPMTAMTQSDHWCTLRYTSEFSWNTGNKQNIWKFNTHTYLAKHVTCRYEQTIITIKQFNTHTWMKAYCKKVWNVRMLRVDMRVHLR